MLFFAHERKSQRIAVANSGRLVVHRRRRARLRWSASCSLAVSPRYRPRSASVSRRKRRSRRAALAAAEIWRLRTGRSQQTVSVDMRAAAIEFRSERHMRLGDKPPGPDWDKIAGVYRTGDGRYVRLHTNFPHHREGMLKLLGCDYERDAVQAALLKWKGEEFETAAAEAKLVATMMRSPAEWAAHPQGQCGCAACP